MEANFTILTTSSAFFGRIIHLGTISYALASLAYMYLCQVSERMSPLIDLSELEINSGSIKFRLGIIFNLCYKDLPVT